MRESILETLREELGVQNAGLVLKLPHRGAGKRHGGGGIRKADCLKGDRQSPWLRVPARLKG